VIPVAKLLAVDSIVEVYSWVLEHSEISFSPEYLSVSPEINLLHQKHQLDLSICWEFLI